MSMCMYCVKDTMTRKRAAAAATVIIKIQTKTTEQL